MKYWVEIGLRSDEFSHCCLTSLSQSWKQTWPFRLDYVLCSSPPTVCPWMFITSIWLSKVFEFVIGDQLYQFTWFCCRVSTENSVFQETFHLRLTGTFGHPTSPRAVILGLLYCIHPCRDVYPWKLGMGKKRKGGEDFRESGIGFISVLSKSGCTRSAFKNDVWPHLRPRN